MMQLPKTVGYAVHALCCMENADGQPMFIRDIAEQTGIPKFYLAKIFNQLVHEGVILAKRGYRGGVVLAKPARSVSLLDILHVVEGHGTDPHVCFFGLDHGCVGNQNVCPAHKMWIELRGQMTSALQRTTLADIAVSLRGKKLGVAAETAPPVAWVGRRACGGARSARPSSPAPIHREPALLCA